MTILHTRWPTSVALCIALTSLSSAQAPSVTTLIPVDLSACSEVVFTVKVTNPNNQPTANGELRYCLSDGLSYLGAAGITVGDSSNLRCPQFILPSIPAKDSLTFSLRVRVGCFPVDVGERRDTLFVSLNNNPLLPFLGSTYNIRTPLITLTPGINWSFSGANGEVFTRTFTLRNEGIGNAYQVFVIDPYANAGLELIQTTGIYKGDTLILNGSALGPDGFLAFRDSTVVTQTFRLRGCSLATNAVAYGWACTSGEFCTALRFQQYEVYSSEVVQAVVKVRFERPFVTPQPCRQDSIVLLVENKGQVPAFHLTWTHGLVPNSVLSAQEGVKQSECHPMTQFRAGETLLADASNGLPSEPYLFPLSILKSDPDGPGGLSDEDGDGEFDDLAPGATARLSFLFAHDPQCKPCNQNLTRQYIAADINFVNACNRPETSLLDPANGNIGISFEQHRLEVEHDFILWADSVYTFSYDLDAAYTGLSEICPNDSIIAQFTLPVTLQVPSAFFPEMDGQPVWWWKSDDTTLNLLLPRSHGKVLVPLLVVCPPDIDNSAICTPTYEPRTYRMPVRVYWRCGNGCPFPYELVCIGGPYFTVDCPRPQDSTQQHGIFADTFFVQRLSLGYVDNLLSAQVAPQPGLQLDIALPFDTVLMQAFGRVEGFLGEAFDSAKIELYYWSGGSPFFHLLSAQLVVADIETGLSATCAGLQPAYREIDGYHIWAFDLLPLAVPGGCLANSGIRLTAGDSIRLELLAQMTQGLPTREARFVNDLRIRFPYRVGGDTLLCKTANAAFRCINPLYDVNLLASIQDGVCGHLVLDVFLQQGVSGKVSTDLFPGEIRPLFAYDTLTVEIPLGYTYVPGSSQWLYRVGDGVLGEPPAAVVSLPDPDILPLANGHQLLRYVRPAGLPVTDYYKGGAASSLSLMLNVFCPPDTAIFPVRIIGNSYFSLFDTVSVFYNGFTGHLENLNETGLEALNAVSNLREPAWRIRLCNPSSGMRIPEPVLFFDNKGRMPLLTVLNVSSLPDTQVLAIEPSSDGQWLVRLPELAAPSCIELLVRAAAPVDCQPDTLRVRAGFRCPGQVEPCFLKRDLELYYRLDPALPQVIVLSSPTSIELCTPVPYEVYLVNQGEGPMYDIFLLLQLPEAGLTYVSGSLSAEYNGVRLPLPDPQLTPAGLQIWVNFAQLPFSLEALPGLAFAPNNVLVFRFLVAPNCDYLDAARIRYRAAWQDACVSSEKKTDRFAAPPPNILGAPTQTNNYAINFRVPEVAAHCSHVPVRVRIANPGNLGPTQAGEKIRLVLPEGFQYVAGSVRSIHNGPTLEPSTAIADGNLFLVFDLPQGVGAGDSIVFEIVVRNQRPAPSCAYLAALKAQMLQTVTLPCGTSSCQVSFAMLEAETSLLLEKNRYALANLRGTAVPLNSNTERWDMQVEILNASAVRGEGSLTLEVFLDADMNGILDTKDSFLRFVGVPIDSLLPLTATPVSFTVQVPSTLGCAGIWVILRDTACACLADTIYLSVNTPLHNAGPDLILCAGQEVILGSIPLAGATYAWSPPSSVSNPKLPNPSYRYDGPFDASMQYEQLLLLTTTRAQGCKSQDTVRIVTRKVKASLTAIPIRCAGDSTGVLRASVSGAWPPVQYLWDDLSIADSLRAQLPAGTYRLTVRDSLGCSDTVSAVVHEPSPLVVQLNSSNYNGFGVSCAGARDGSISAFASGGIPPYAYQWQPTGNGANLSSLPPGTYALTLTDANLCTWEAIVVLTEPLPLQVSIVAEDERCIGSANGNLSLTISGGVGPYRINNQPPGGATQVLTDLSGGSYTVIVTDANGCSISAEATLQTLTSMVSVSADSVRCFGGSDGRAEVLASGYSPFAYVWSNKDTTAAIVAPAGTYTVTVSDALGCTYVLQTKIDQPSLLTGQVVAQGVRCFGDSNGRIELSAQGGTPPYRFDQGGQPVSSPITGLSPGTYTFTLTDAKGCVASLTALVSQPAPLGMNFTVTDVRCAGQKTGAVLAQPSGGTPPYAYAWSNGANTVSIQSLAGGSYTLTLTDGAGCTFTATAKVREPEPYTPNFEVERTPCANRANGILVVSGFPQGTRYRLNQLPDTDIPRFVGVGGGSLKLTVLDTAGCRFDYDFNMPTLPAQLGEVLTDTTIRLGDSAYLRVQLSPQAVNAAPVRFRWVNPSDVLAGCDTCLALWVQPLRTTLYLVEFTTESGCRSESRVVVRVVRDGVYAPNVIHPEALTLDNQRFMLYARTGLVRSIRLMRVFDRWGELLFEQRAFAPNDPALGWDGHYRGQPLNPGVYIWYAEVEYLDGAVELLKGDVLLVR
ncbi:MAG: hypothetical protein NZM43_03150 [Saprospiraceae bacterium]|nr:hypothetical protein [Saprospiraceae bacterium]MDW8483300.1 hypothetical protein [Saprospiraceae bacterium]